MVNLSRDHNRIPRWFWPCFVLLLISALFLQQHIFLIGDVSWLMHTAASLLQGGRYNVDFFETNPPLILYQYLIPVLASKFLHCSMVTAVRGFVGILALLSIGSCHFLLRRIFSEQQTLCYVVLLAITFALLLLPTLEFAQREHLLMILILPYLLIVVLRAMQHPVPLLTTILFGCMAGLGLGIKPYFLITPLLLECYLAWQQKNIFAWWRAENIAIAVVLLLYLVSIFVYSPDYIRYTLPLVTDLYFPGLPGTLWKMLLMPPVVGWLLVICSYFVGKDFQPYRQFDHIFLIAASGFLLAFIWQRAPWLYHWLPTLMLLTILLLKVLVCDYRQAMNARRRPFAAEIAWQQTRVVIQIIIATVALLGFSGFVFITVSDKGIIYKASPNSFVNAASVLVKQYAKNGSVYFLYSFVNGAYPLVDYAPVSSASRFPGLVFLPGLVRLSALPATADQRAKLQQEKHWLFDAVMTDFYRNNPDLVFVDTATWSGYYNNRPFDYLRYFAQDPRFVAIFKHYTYLTRCNNFNVYKKEVDTLGG